MSDDEAGGSRITFDDEYKLPGARGYKDFADFVNKDDDWQSELLRSIIIVTHLRGHRNVDCSKVFRENPQKYTDPWKIKVPAFPKSGASEEDIEEWKEAAKKRATNETGMNNLRISENNYTVWGEIMEHVVKRSGLVPYYEIPRAANFTNHNHLDNLLKTQPVEFWERLHHIDENYKFLSRKDLRDIVWPWDAYTKTISPDQKREEPFITHYYWLYLDYNGKHYNDYEKAMRTFIMNRHGKSVYRSLMARYGTEYMK